MRKHFLIFVCAVICNACNFNLVWVAPKINGTAKHVESMTICVGSVLFEAEADKKQLNNAVSFWDKSLHQWKRIILSEDYSGCGLDVVVTTIPSKEHPSALAWADEIGGKKIFILKSTIQQKYDLAAIMQHELGHIFGAQHIDGTLMNSYFDVRYMNCPDVVTIAQVAAYNKINLDLLSWCY